PSFTFSTSAAIGARGDTLDNSFLGSIDELAVYDRALSAGEIQSIYNALITGKCNTPVTPTIVRQPQSLYLQAGSNAIFTAVTGGSIPLSYQWQLNNVNLAGATNSSLTINNVLPSNSGVYTLIVSNAAGTTTSSNANLQVNLVTIYGNGQLLTNS